MSATSDPSPRIYLDNAATSWPKPEAVYSAVDRYLRDVGAPAGRSGYREATEASAAVQDARFAAARLIDAEEPQRVVFTYSGTDALNLAIHGLVGPADHVVTSVCEHNSVLRPLRHLESTHGVEVTHVRCGADGVVNPQEVRAALRPQTRLVALIHASNVTGALQPVFEVGELLKQYRAKFLVDAAQTLGHFPLSVQNLGIDLLAAPGHKGLLGPLGTGVLYIGPDVEGAVQSLRQGGTGTQSDDDHQPESVPEKYESGNHNVPGIVGLSAGIAYLEEQGLEAIREHITQLTDRLLAGLIPIDAVRVVGPRVANQRVGVVSIQIDGYDPQEVSATLDAAYRVQVRAGFHCAARMHRELGTADEGGTVRFSLGAFTTAGEIDSAISAVRQIASARLPR